MDPSDPYWGEKPFGRWRARLDLVALAGFAARRVEIGGEPVILKRGQLFASHSFLAKRWGWSIKRVRGFLARLRGEEFIEECAKMRLGTVWEVRNYDRYQSPRKAR